MNTDRQGQAPTLRVHLALGLTISLALLAGCSTTFRGTPDAVSDREADVQALRQQFTSGEVSTCLAAQTDACRNRIIRARKAAEDIRFYEFEEKVFQEGRATGFAATVGTLGLTTASAATTGTIAKVLAGLAALVTGTREAYDKEVLAEKTLQALFAAMRANRAAAELRIRSGLQQPVSAYSLEDGMGDVEAYRRAGTVQAALDTVTETASVKAKESEQELKGLKERVSFRLDDAAKRLRLVLCGTGSCAEMNEIEVARMKRDCWPKAKVPEATRTSDFMLQDVFAAMRSEVGACMAPN